MTSLPLAFIDRMKSQLGEEANAFFESLKKDPTTSIRLHHRKGKLPFTNTHHVPWCEEGYYLERRPSFHLDPHWHGGAYYVQEASSMVLDAVIRNLDLENIPRIWLDMCAAPGGKSGILAKHMHSGDVLVANEVVPQRRSILRENLIKAGYLNTFITGEQSLAFKEPFADIILIDAPCAGEGMMRKEPEAIRQWSPGLVRECSLMQRKIFNESIRALKKNGYLIYSTCSYSEDENLNNVSDFISSHALHSVEMDFPTEWNITVINRSGITGYQLYPHKLKGEGLFVSVLKNLYGEGNTFHKKSNHFINPAEWMAQHINDEIQLRFLKISETNQFITATAEEKANEVLHLFPRAELISDAGQLKGKDFIPSHFLAMSELGKNRNGAINVNLSIALDYLERNTQTLPPGSSPGWYLVMYDQTVIGWAKMTSQGWKNHYPLNWRLRSRKM